MYGWAGPLLAASALLVLAAVPKLRDPADTVRALRASKLPASAAAVRLLAAAEAAIGILAVVSGSRTAAVLVAGSYLTFSAFVIFLRSRDGVVSSCGCFGTPDTPPTLAHVAVTALLAGGAAGAAVAPVGPVTNLLDVPLPSALALLLLTSICTALGYLALAVLPTLALASEES